MRGSFFVFAFLALCGRLRNRHLVYLVLAAFLVQVDFLLLEFLAGLLLCDLAITNTVLAQRVRGQAREWLGGVLVVLGLFFGGMTPAWTVVIHPALLLFANYWEPIGAVLLIAGTVVSKSIQRILRHRVFAFLGKISFSLYLLHLPVICSLGCWTYLWLAESRGLSHDLSGVLAAVAVAAISMLLAWLSAVSLERFSIRLGHRIDERVFRPVSAPHS